METEACREPYSVERIERELKQIEKTLMDMWENIQALCHLTGQDTSKHPLGPKAVSEEPGVPMIRIFMEIDDIKQISGHFDDQLHKLAHEIHPSYFETIKKKPH